MNNPTAYITQNRQRVRQYGRRGDTTLDTTFLKDGDEFEIELFNPTQTKTLAKISINGRRISQSGIVINPGQRIFLERYIDDNHKFVFNTYEVDNGNADVDRAIAKNGNIQIDFFNEVVPSVVYTTDNTPIRYYTWNPTYIRYYSSTNTSNTFVPSTFTTSTNMLCCAESTSTYATADTLSIPKKETGIVSKGGRSDQSFTTVNDTFSSSCFLTINWKILPLSQKPYDVTDDKVYCTSCGAKRKKQSHKFCPHCGTKF
jgi:hypothetical protein